MANSHLIALPAQEISALLSAAENPLFAQLPALNVKNGTYPLTDFVLLQNLKPYLEA